MACDSYFKSLVVLTWSSSITSRETECTVWLILVYRWPKGQHQQQGLDLDASAFSYRSLFRRLSSPRLYPLAIFCLLARLGDVVMVAFQVVIHVHLA